MTLSLLDILYVTNFANYLNTQLGTKIIVTPDGVLDKENSSFITRDGEMISDSQLSELMISYGENMQKIINIFAEAALDGAVAGIADCMSGTNPNITMVVTSRE